MNKVILAFTILAAASFNCAASIDSLINSGKCIAKARELYDSGNYELAIKELDRIDPRDTNYIYSLSEKSKALFESKQYIKVTEVCAEGLKKKSPYRSSLFQYMALGYSAQSKYDQALASVTDGLKEFPFDYSLMYRYGLILYEQKKFDEAEEKFFKAIDLAPYHMGSHLYLSKMAMRKGYKVEGMFAMGLYLALNNQENSQLQLLESFVKNELTDEKTIPQGSVENPFSRLDEIIRAKISFENDYTLKIPIDIGIVRQYQLLFEQIASQTYSSDSPWIKFYLKIYTDLIKAGGQEAFIYHVLQSSSIEKVKQWKDKNEKKMQQFYNTMNTSLKQTRSVRALPAPWGYKNPVACGYYDDGHIESIGDKDKGGKKTGKWYYFDSNGEKLAVGNYSEDKKVGVWSYTNASGIPTSIEDYNTDEIKIFDDDGAMSQHYHLKDSGIEGNFQLFHSCGALNETRGYTKGMRNGPGKNYFPNGKLKMEFVFKNDSLHGPYTEWYDTGGKHSEVNYKAGKLNGKYTSYFTNGKIKSTGNYTSGIAEGMWFYYYESGRLKQKGNYKGDSTVGVWETFNDNGTIIERRDYDKQGPFDEEATFFHDGVMHYVMQINNGKAVSLTYYNKSGAVVGSSSNKEGTFHGKGYAPTGELEVEFDYVKGYRSGLWKYYSPYGFLESSNLYTDGLLNGEGMEYYPSGAIKVKSNYVLGNLDGLYTEYHPNGKVKLEGWYSNGLRQQRWQSYFIDGSLESDMYYLNDVLSGYALEFTEDKKLYLKSEYNSVGKLKGMARYTEAGHDSKMEATENNGAVLVQKNSAGVCNYKSEFACGEWNGQTNMYLNNGKLYRKLNYLNGNLHGKFESYYADGSLDGSGDYVAGNPVGYWKWNNVDGSKYCEGRYFKGAKDSLWTYFYYTGKISNLTNYSNGEKNGEAQVFGLDGQLVFVKKFDLGKLVAYKEAGKDGKLSDWKPFKGNETLTGYYANGKLAITEPYKNGEYHGFRKSYFPTGQLFNSYEYNYGLSIGEGLLYYPNGKIKQKSSYVFDNPSGNWEYYDVNGNLLRRESYLSGSLSGKTEFFASGKISGSQNFFGGFPAE